MRTVDLGCLVGLILAPPLSAAGAGLADTEAPSDEQLLVCPEGVESPEYLTNTHAAVSEWALSRPGSEVEEFIVEQLQIPEGLLLPCIDGTAAEHLAQGAVDEDDGLRVLNHFYDPTQDRGLTDIGAGQSSLEWAWTNTPGQTGWMAARVAQERWLAAHHPLSRELGCKEMFIGLGHVIHLIQDLAQPQHTRNDAHPPLVGGAPYETYVGEHYGTLEQIQTLGLAPIPVWAQDELPEPDGAEQVSKGFKAFWDTEQYQGQDPFAGFTFTPGLAEYTNFFFVTDDTMFTSDEFVVVGSVPSAVEKREWRNLRVI